MSERDWKEEQCDVLTRLFDAAFNRREVPVKVEEPDIHWLGAVTNLSGETNDRSVTG